METCCSRFTAAEGGARLAAVVSMKNTIITEHCSFVATRLLYEDAYKIRGLLSEGRQRSVYLTRASRIAYVAYELSILTDLAIGQSVKYEDIDDWSGQLEEKEVIVCTSNTLQQILKEGLLSIPVINVLVIDSCHLISIDEDLKYVMDLYKQCEESSRPRLLALTYPLFTSASNDNEQLENGNKNNEEREDKSDVEDETISDTDIVNADQVIDNNDTIENVNENKELVNDNNEIVVSAEDLAVVIKNKKYSIGDYQNVDDFEMYEKLGWKIEELENDLHCEMDLAEDIDGGKRLSATISKPKEVIIEFGKQLSLDNLPDQYKELDQYMRNTIQDAMDFINEHRYDPMEIYGEDLLEEFMNIPDPTREPKELFYQFLYILDELGPYAADKAAFYLLTKLEKLKVKVPYERHFLLLCMCTSLLVKIRAFADNIFSQFTDWEKIQTFCTPKLLRFSEILEQFRPTESKKIEENRVDSSENAIDSGKSEINTSKTTNMLKTINDCDFITLGNKIEDRVNTYEANLKEIENVPEECGNTGDSCGSKSDSSLGIVEISSKTEVKKDESKLLSDTNKVDSLQSGTNLDRNISLMRGTRHRVRGRGRVPRNNSVRVQQAQQNPDALCGIVFVKEPLMTKIIFMLIVDMTRCQPSLNHVSAQYCANETTGSELKECQRQSRKQEDVLKKFRMHECNLLLATPALEEGIDLPRCNLVVRWDVPPSYRSHSLCRGRARAPRSALALLAEAPEYSKLLLHHLAIYRELDQIISRKCGCGIQDEPPPEEENHADDFTPVVKAYSPIEIKAITSLKDTEVNLAKNISKKYLQQLIKVICERKIINTETENVKNIIKYLKESEPEVIEGNCKDKIETNSNIEGSEEKKQIEDSDRINGKKNFEDSLSDNEIKSFVDEIETIDESRNIKNDVITDLVKQIDCIQIDSRNVSSKFQDSKDSANDYSDKSESLKEIVENVNRCTESLSVDSSKDCVNCETETGVKRSDSDCVASVDLSTAIALINRYCGKLPSDTFTRLAPQWWMEEVQLPDRDGNMRKAYICTLRLPLNCPVKYNIVGHPMPTRVLARRMVALQACRILHKSGELDNQLMPIGKENFKAAELEGTSNLVNNCANINGDATELNDSARPGTTKRRQYYFKRTAWAFTDCQPVIDASDSEIDPPDSAKRDAEPKQEVKSDAKRNTLYAIDSRLWCALPERYNTRGRRLHAPQHASQAIGILMARHQPDKLQIPAFPVYTRSGEVRVSVQLAPAADVRLSPRRARLVRRFMRFVFSDVLRVRRRGMKLQSEGSTHNNYYIVPTIKTTKEDGTTMVDVDWGFLELIYKHTEEKKSLEVEKPLLFHQDEEDEDEALEDKMLEKDRVKDKDGKVKKMENPLLKPGETFVFDPEKYKEAVVTPWYRNQDQPQFFLVAEICWNLTPDSAFPSATHTTFRDYYSTKYGVVLTQPNQPLLDVDHTSARLNLLTPRYVNRKGVALPVSSERTRRAKRDRLDQKQILLPELCRVHPFAAPLWFATVALPCVLYRINALLIADEIRRAVAIDVGLGIPKIDENTCPGFQWLPLDFGWSLAEVLSADSEKNEKKKDEEDPIIKEQRERELREKEENERRAREEEEQKKKETEKTINDILQEKEDAANGFEIGTWSNDMASSIPDTVEFDDYLEPLPSNLTFCTSASGGGNWSDPIEKPKMQYGGSRTFSMADSDCSYMSSDFDTDDSDLNSEGSDEDTDTSGFCSSKNSNAAMGVRIEYKTAREAEAVDLERAERAPAAPQPSAPDDTRDRAQHRAALRAAAPPPRYIEQFRESVTKHEKEIVDKGFLLDKDKPITDLLPEASRDSIEKLIAQTKPVVNLKEVEEIFPYGSEELSYSDGQITIESIEKNKRLLLSKLKECLPKEDIKRMNCFSMKDVDIDSPDYVNEKVVNVGFDTEDSYKEKIEQWHSKREFKPYYQEGRVQNGKEFDFDYQPDLEGHPGPSPSVILQALTMSNANDGINLERLETIGDSFLKFAITAYLYCAHPTVHEGKLSHMRSKQVSNLNLYRLGRSKRLGARMTASKFEPHDNWLPPCHRAPHTLHRAPVSTATAATLTKFEPHDNWLPPCHRAPHTLHRAPVSTATAATLTKFEPHDNWLPPCHRAPHTLHRAPVSTATAATLTKFEPHDNWLPPCHRAPHTLHRAPVSTATAATLTKFEPHDNWLPPCHRAPHTLHRAPVSTATAATRTKFEPHDNWLPPCHRAPHTLHRAPVSTATAATRTKFEPHDNWLPPCHRAPHTLHCAPVSTATAATRTKFEPHDNWLPPCNRAPHTLHRAPHTLHRAPVSTATAATRTKFEPHDNWLPPCNRAPHTLHRAPHTLHRAPVSTATAATRTKFEPHDNWLPPCNRAPHTLHRAPHTLHRAPVSTATAATRTKFEPHDNWLPPCNRAPHTLHRAPHTLHRAPVSTATAATRTKFEPHDNWLPPCNRAPHTLHRAPHTLHRAPVSTATAATRTKFEPHDNWLPPCNRAPHTLHRAPHTLHRAPVSTATAATRTKFEPHDNWLPPCNRAPHTLHRAPHTLHRAPHTLHRAPVSTATAATRTKFEPHDNWLPPCNRAPHTLHRAPHTLHRAPHTLHRAPVSTATAATRTKFEPHDNWLPPCYRAPHTLHRAPSETQEQPIGDGPVDSAGCFIPYNLITQHSIPDKSIADCVEALIGAYLLECGPRGALLFMSWLGIRVLPRHDLPLPENHPYVVAHKDDHEDAPTPVIEKSPSPRLPKREIRDSDSDWSEEEEEDEEEEVEGPNSCGPQELGPEEEWGWPARPVGSLKPYLRAGTWYQPIFGALKAPPSPLLRYIEDPEGELEQMLSGYEALERTLQYRFQDRSLLLQALTHASHQRNRLTDCYQRLEFLGDAILDYLITRHLYEDARRHSPGALTDLRSALVNNTIFATLAARHGFHKYFRHMSPGLNEVLTKYVKIQEENGHSISEEHYLIHEDEMEQAEDVEVPKALGDLFESVAGAIFLDSGMSLGAVWRSYVRLMGAELEAFSAAAPKSPVRELLEAEPDTAKFGKPERLADGRRVRVCVEVFGRGTFKGVGRNYRIAKGTAARCALRHLKIHRAR